VKRLLLAPLALLAACAITDDSGLGVAKETPVRTGTVFLVKDNFYTPVADTIRAGQHASWAWVGKKPHGLMFSSGAGNKVIVNAQITGGFDTVMTTPGTYTFACTVMIAMTGKLVVTQ
jgi:plastocyanin